MTLRTVTGQGLVFWDDLEEGAVIDGPGMTITDAHLLGWAGLTGDLVSLHLDDEFAAASPFGKRVAAGPLTMALGLGLVTQTGIFGNVRAWLGVDSVRALAPVYLGDTIRPQAVIVEKRETKKPDQGIWALDYTVRNQDDVEVMTFTSRKLIFKRPAGGDAAQAHGVPSSVAHV
jgi:itaconyl-CoA hydratase